MIPPSHEDTVCLSGAGRNGQLLEFGIGAEIEMALDIDLRKYCHSETIEKGFTLYKTCGISMLNRVQTAGGGHG